MLLSSIILFLALLTLWLGHWWQAKPSETVDIREVSLVAPPPPPPPPPTMQQAVVETPVNLQVQGAGPSIQMIKIEQQIEAIKPDVPSIDTTQTEWQSLEINWDAFDLNDLDGLPVLLSPLRVTFPKSLTRKGIRKVLVKLDVVISEQGQATLINIVSNPHPELISEIQRLVRNSRFTAPQKDNQSVRARFIWPVEIES
jgi:outer membrane biosynthesis protein TonB